MLMHVQFILCDVCAVWFRISWSAFEEAWAEIKALAVETIPDVVPAGGRKKETTMILVGR